jgi:hypothetical protein
MVRFRQSTHLGQTPAGSRLGQWLSHNQWPYPNPNSVRLNLSRPPVNAPDPVDHQPGLVRLGAARAHRHFGRGGGLSARLSTASTRIVYSPAPPALLHRHVNPGAVDRRSIVALTGPSGRVGLRTEEPCLRRQKGAGNRLFDSSNPLRSAISGSRDERAGSHCRQPEPPRRAARRQTSSSGAGPSRVRMSLLVKGSPSDPGSARAPRRSVMPSSSGRSRRSISPSV